jgi:hypothetical protein
MDDDYEVSLDVRFSILTGTTVSMIMHRGKSL